MNDNNAAENERKADQGRGIELLSEKYPADHDNQKKTQPRPYRVGDADGDAFYRQRETEKRKQISGDNGNGRQGPGKACCQFQRGRGGRFTENGDEQQNPVHELSGYMVFATAVFQCKIRCRIVTETAGHGAFWRVPAQCRKDEPGGYKSTIYYV